MSFFPLSAMDGSTAGRRAPSSTENKSFFAGLLKRFTTDSSKLTPGLLDQKISDFLILTPIDGDGSPTDAMDVAIHELSFSIALTMDIAPEDATQLLEKLKKLSEGDLIYCSNKIQEQFFSGLTSVPQAGVTIDPLVEKLAFQAGALLQQKILRAETSTPSKSRTTFNPGGSPSEHERNKTASTQTKTQEPQTYADLLNLLGRLSEEEWTELEGTAPQETRPVECAPYCGAGLGSAPKDASSAHHAPCKSLPTGGAIYFLNGFKFSSDDAEGIKRTLEKKFTEYIQEGSPKNREMLVHNIAFFAGLLERQAWNTKNPGMIPGIAADDTTRTECDFLSGFFNKEIKKGTPAFTKIALNAGQNMRRSLQKVLRATPRKNLTTTFSFRSGFKQGYLEEHLENLLDNSLWPDAKENLDLLNQRYLTLTAAHSRSELMKELSYSELIKELSYYVGIMRGSACANINKWELNDFITGEESFSEEALQAKFMEGFNNPDEDSPDTRVDPRDTSHNLLIIAKGCGIIARQDIDALIAQHKKERIPAPGTTAARLRRKLEQKKKKTQNLATDNTKKPVEPAQAEASPSACVSAQSPSSTREKRLPLTEDKSKKIESESALGRADHDTPKPSASALKRAKKKAREKEKKASRTEKARTEAAAIKIQSMARQVSAKNHAALLRQEKTTQALLAEQAQIEAAQAKIAEEQQQITLRVIKDAQDLAQKESDHTQKHLEQSKANKARFDALKAEKQKNLEIKAALNIQKIFRGHRARTYFTEKFAEEKEKQELTKKAIEEAAHQKRLIDDLEEARQEAARHKAKADELTAKLLALEQARSEEKARQARGDAKILELFNQLPAKTRSESTHSTGTSESPATTDSTEDLPYEADPYAHAPETLPYHSYQPYMLPTHVAHGPHPMPYPPHFTPYGIPYPMYPAVPAPWPRPFPGFAYTPGINSFPPVRPTVPPPPKDWKAEGKKIFLESPTPQARENWRQATLNAIEKYAKRDDSIHIEINTQLLAGFDEAALEAQSAKA